MDSAEKTAAKQNAFAEKKKPAEWPFARSLARFPPFYICEMRR